MIWFLLSWALRRRPMEEGDQLLAIAAASQRGVRFREEVREMGRSVRKTWTDSVMEEGQALGQILTSRENLRLLLSERFGTVPEELVARIEGTEDLERLRNALRQFVHIQSLSELEL
jgi:hypothetical protein